MKEMLWRKPIVLGLLLITMVSGAYAQNRFEIEPFVGARFGGRITINTPDVDYLPIDSSLNWGFTTGVSIIPHLFGEFMFNRQTTTLSAHDTLLGQTIPLTTRAHLDLYHFDLLYEFWTPSKIRPFVVGGIGDTHFDTHGVVSFEDRFSYNLGGGVSVHAASGLARGFAVVALAHNCCEHNLLRSFSRLFHHAGESSRGAGAGRRRFGISLRRLETLSRVQRYLRIGFGELFYGGEHLALHDEVRRLPENKVNDTVP
jgi:hypothetical protein